MRGRIWPRLFPTAIALTLLAAACGGGGEATPETEQPAEPVILRVGMPGSPDSQNPGNTYLTEGFDLIELVYDALVSFDFAGNYHPELAESWTTSDDGLVWTFTLREGAMFSDGTPVTAQDVAFSLLAYRDWGDFGYISGYATHFADVQAPDERTVVLTLDAPVGNLESQLLFCYILPEHIWGQFAGDVDAALAFENAEMIGAGPFRLVEYRQGEFYRLAANKDHYLTPPVVDEVIFQTYTNQDALVQALRDPIVRQAMAHAVDKQQVIDVAELGLGAPGLGLVPVALGDFYASELEDYAFDIALANQMLDEAGYLDTDGDGIRECPAGMDCGGRQLDIGMQIPSDIGSGPREAELLSGWWAQIGIRMTPQVLEPDTVTANCCPAFDFDMLMWGWTSDPDPSFILSVLTSVEIPTGLSETGYNNPEYDRLFDGQTVELDHATRVQMVHDMQRMMLEDLPYIIPYYQEELQAFRSDRFTNWPVPAEGSGDILYLQDPLSLTVVRPVQ